MHLHTSLPRTSARRLLAICLVGALAVSACGGEETAEPTATTAGAPAPDAGTAGATPASDAPAATAEPVATTPAATAAPAETVPAGDATGGAIPTDLCATIPPLDAMNAVLSEPVTAAANLPRTPGEAMCDVTGDGASNVSFGVLTDVTREEVDEIVAELGYTVTDVADPALPGGYGYAGLAAVIVDGTQYSVQMIDLDVIMDAANPQWITRSAELLKQWLALLGVTP